MLFAGSRVSLKHGALKSTAEYDGARADVLHLDEAKGRYALELIHPRFEKKRLLCKAEALEFHFALLRENILAARSEIGKRKLAFEEPPLLREGGETSSIGKALLTRKAFQVDELVLVDAPFLVVSSPASIDRWVRRWDCYYDSGRL